MTKRRKMKMKLR